jgi:hypothetical protein
MCYLCNEMFEKALLQMKELLQYKKQKCVANVGWTLDLYLLD